MSKTTPGAKTGGFAQQWRAELPRVAASLTTALALFLASLTFAPVREFFFGEEVRSYPIFCTADPVVAPGGRRIVEFYIVNRSPDDYTADALQRELNEALRGTGSSASAAIVLPFDGVEGRIERAYADADFNRGKGELLVRAEPGAVRLVLRQIDGGAILRAVIVLADMPDIGPIPRDAKVAVPFDFQDIQQACYTRG